MFVINIYLDKMFFETLFNQFNKKIKLYLQIRFFSLQQGGIFWENFPNFIYRVWSEFILLPSPNLITSLLFWFQFFDFPLFLSNIIFNLRPRRAMNKLVLAEAKCLGTKNRKYPSAGKMRREVDWVEPAAQMKVRQSTLSS